MIVTSLNAKKWTMPPCCSPRVISCCCSWRNLATTSVMVSIAGSLAKWIQVREDPDWGGERAGSIMREERPEWLFRVLDKQNHEMNENNELKESEVQSTGESTYGTWKTLMRQ